MKPPGEVVALVMLTCFFLAFVPAEGQPCQPIEWRSFKGCECNILGACNVDGNVNQDNNPTLDGYAPAGIEQFAYIKPGGVIPNLAYLCEGGTVAILYDCNARIPLYAATVMTGKQLYDYIGNRPSGVKTSIHLDGQFQQSGDDYDASTKRHLCYETIKNYFVESDWLNAAESQNVVGPNEWCCAPNVLASAVHKGHLIAARYARGNNARVKATFAYTNTVPQFANFNCGQWSRAEQRVIDWGKDRCFNKGVNRRNVRIYVVVGAVRSGYFFNEPARFFGQSGFSDYQGTSQFPGTYGPSTGKKDYRVNVPSYMWTAACCTYQYRGQNGMWKSGGVQSMAFYGKNDPSNKVSYQNFFQVKNLPVHIFPKNNGCDL